MKVTIEKEIDLDEYGLISKAQWMVAKKLLADVYGSLWCEAYYDPYNEDFLKFCRPLAEKMSAANDLLKFKE